MVLLLSCMQKGRKSLHHTASNNDFLRVHFETSCKQMDYAEQHELPLVGAAPNPQGDAMMHHQVGVEALPSRRYEFLWWGIIRRGTDFLVLAWIIIGPLMGTMCFVAVSTMSLTRNIVGMIVAGLALWISAVALFIKRSQHKLGEYQQQSHQGLMPPHGKSHVRTLGYSCRHTLMEVVMVAGATAVLQAVEAMQERASKGQNNDEITSPLDFWIIYIQIIVSTAIFFYYYFQVQAISKRIRQNIIPPNVGLVWLHLVAFLSLLQGWSRLAHLAWVANPWATPLYLLEALAAMGVVARWCFRPPEGGEPDP